MANETQQLNARLVVDADVDKAAGSLGNLADVMRREVHVQQQEMETKIEKLNSLIDQQSRKALESRRQIVSAVANVFGAIQGAVGEADTGLGKFLGRTATVVLMANQFGQLANSIMAGAQAMRTLGQTEATINAARFGLGIVGSGRGGVGNAASKAGVAASPQASSFVSDVTAGAVGSTIGNAMDGMSKGSLLTKLSGMIPTWAKTLGSSVASLFTAGTGIVAAALVAGTTLLSTMALSLRDKNQGNRNTEAKLDKMLLEPMLRWTVGWFTDLEEAGANAVAKAIAGRQEQNKIRLEMFAKIFDAESAAAVAPHAAQNELEFIQRNAQRRTNPNALGDQRDENALRWDIAVRRLAAASADAQKYREAGGGTAMLGEEARRREQEARQREKEALEALIGVEKERVSIIRQQHLEMRKVLEGAKTFAANLTETAKSALDAQRDRIKSAKEDFGSQSASKRDDLKEIGRKLKAGENLNRFEMEEAQKHPAIFGQILAERGRKRADAEGFGELADNVGLNVDRQRNAVALAKSIEVNVSRSVQAIIGLDEKLLREELANAVGPLMKSLIFNVNRSGVLAVEKAYSEAGEAAEKRKALPRTNPPS